MMASLDDKKELVQKHIEGLDVLEKQLGESKEVVLKNLRQNKEIYRCLDQAESKIKIEKAFVVRLQETEPSQIPEERWVRYKGIVRHTGNVCASGETFHHDLSQPERQQEQFLTAAHNLNSLLTGVTNTTYYAFKDIPLLEGHLVLLEESNTIHDDVGFIKSELSNLLPSAVSAFDKIFVEWQTADAEIKYTSLGDLRALIIYQLFDTLCEESKYTKTPWHSGGQKRFCQAKYFMIGNTDESTLIPTIRLQVDSAANKIQSYFDQLSEGGKYGEDQATVDSIFSDTVSTFVQCLQLRKSYYVREPQKAC